MPGKRETLAIRVMLPAGETAREGLRHHWPPLEGTCGALAWVVEDWDATAAAVDIVSNATIDCLQFAVKQTCRVQRVSGSVEDSGIPASPLDKFAELRNIRSKDISRTELVALGYFKNSCIANQVLRAVVRLSA